MISPSVGLAEREWTHHADGSDELLRRRLITRDDLGNEVGCQADDDDHANGLQAAHDLEGETERAIVWASHVGKDLNASKSEVVVNVENVWAGHTEARVEHEQRVIAGGKLESFRCSKEKSVLLFNKKPPKR